jgi:hypothetical protein
VAGAAKVDVTRIQETLTPVKPPYAQIDNPQARLDWFVSAVVRRNLSWDIHYKDAMGEGPGRWHSAPRLPGHVLNCLTWLQVVLAQSYALCWGLRFPMVLDSIRYFHGIVGFSTRKHYVDQWLRLDPGPLRLMVDSPAFHAGTLVSRIEPTSLQRLRGFNGDLYAARFTDLLLPYFTYPSLLKRLAEEKNQHVILFGVPTPEYLACYSPISGPIALGHAILCERDSTEGSGGYWRCYHASTALGRVVDEELLTFMERCSGNYRGFVACALCAQWRPTRPEPSMQQYLRHLLVMESSLPTKEDLSESGFF